MSSSYEAIDKAYSEYISEHPNLIERWLLVQTLYSAPQRRSVLPFLPIQPGIRVLDVGTGFGALAFDLAASNPLQIEAVDVNLQELEVAQDIHERVIQQGSLLDSNINFSEANVYDLPYSTGSFDFVISRFVFQHLKEPKLALQELYRVLRPSGVICLMDIDDQLIVTYPEPSPAYQLLETALHQLQVHSGGDRYVGRKLPHYLYQTGFRNINPLMLPQAQFTYQEADSLATRFLIEKFQHLRNEIVRKGILQPEKFDQALNALREQTPFWSFDSTSQIVVLGQKP